jgi:RHS repeat-associated protein
VLTEEQQSDCYPPASMESAQSTTEEAIYSHVNTTRNDLPAGYPTDTYTNPNNKVSKVNGSGNKIGPSIVLKVMAGDKFNIRVSSWYKTYGATPGTPVNPLTDLLNALTNNIGSITSTHGGITGTELSNSGVLSPGATSFLNNQPNNTGKPKAYVNWILFDEQFKYVSSSSGAEQVGANEEFKVHLFNDKPIDKSGYLYVYVSNETPNIDVFFDNLQVTHIRGPLLETNEYYPFGLLQAGISYKTLKGGYAENKKKYNGIDFENDLELNTYDAFFRELDPQTGRWWQIDPVTDGYENLSPYASMYNNPITVSDPLGDEGESCCWDKIKEAANYVGGAVVGAVVGTVDNVTGSNIRGQLSSNFAGTGAAGNGWNMGLNVADAGGVVLGVAEIGTGAAGVIGAGAGTLLTAGVGSPVTVPVGVGSAALATHGVFTVSNSANNLVNQNGRVDASSNSSSGRSGKQQKLREVANDPKAGKSDKGWIKQEQNSIERGNRKSIRVPPGKNLAHDRGKEARKGNSYKDSKLQDIDLHKTQHRVERKAKRNNNE